MPNPSLDPEIIISRLAYRPDFSTMIEITEPPKPPIPILADRVSSLGMLDRFPPEIISILLCMLDMQSLACFAGVSFLGNISVQSQRAYQELVTFAGPALWALGKVGLIGVHSVADLHAALRTEDCAACAQYGAFLFLLNCERCCWQCLYYNPLFRVVTQKDAGEYFGLSEQHVQCLPTLHVIPGQYGLPGNYPPKCRGLVVVSVKAARNLGLMVQGSTQNLAQAMASRCKSPKRRIMGQYLQQVPTVSQSRDLLFLPSQMDIASDEFFGVASIPLPSVSKSGRVENGLCAQEVVAQLETGCRVMFPLE
ncbi:hypothetical protein E0Z10_g7244 [Xylaria hypoxylon]|uniref:F-box domain-containing protein n=1 Tax=Xylaria hypoxylon TaxID=37992 RepID=A0A4Z0YBB5_9PEZI|nr:hypothetical protein E0Z10_g7244 [Xylaria hypoxylon]